MVGRNGRAGRFSRGGAALGAAVTLALIPLGTLSLGAVSSGAFSFGSWGEEPTAQQNAVSAISGVVRIAAGHPSIAEPPADGNVTYAGTPPAPEPIDMSADGYCADQHSSPVMDSPVRVGAAGGVEGVLIHVSNASSGSGPAPGEALLDQIGCIYAPGSVVVGVGETIVIRNSDQTLHNVRVSPTTNRGFNLGQPMRGIESRRSFDQPEVGIPVRCDIHGWMTASIHVLDHGFFAVSGPDGAFELPDLPAGDWTVEAWHAELGTTRRTISVAGGAPVSLDFEFTARD